MLETGECRADLLARKKEHHAKGDQQGEDIDQAFDDHSRQNRADAGGMIAFKGQGTRHLARTRKNAVARISDHHGPKRGPRGNPRGNGREQNAPAPRTRNARREDDEAGCDQPDGIGGLKGVFEVGPLDIVKRGPQKAPHQDEADREFESGFHEYPRPRRAVSFFRQFS